ncbi:uncharacterized protein LTR77_008540 [Saxophila tyrrhenica]|uniref:NAD(P)-binding protein n=1 Tax=Saxophila tyrrhenica TaxID=1690608 RepID=A0AAV9P187_9PEZI|nr:hypothetical protein LTR77_008540 [Saxophila tyrrhenica]
MAQKTVLVLGCGPNIGSSTVGTFRKSGYRVVSASRSCDGEASDDSTMALKCDLAQPKSVEYLFKTVREEWGEPSVVVYNGCAYYPTKPEESFNIPTENFEQQLAINTTSAFVAMREAANSFARLDGSKTLIFTGTMANEGGVPGWLTLCVGKAAGAYMIDLAENVYREQDARFHCVDERTSEGKPMFEGLGGQAHADVFLDLAERKVDLPWQVTFVSGKGYVEFPHELIL